MGIRDLSVDGNPITTQLDVSEEVSQLKVLLSNSISHFDKKSKAIYSAKNIPLLVHI
jgi:hypothetical protein